MGIKPGPITYTFGWDGQLIQVEAFTYSEARRKFAKKTGIVIDEEFVQISREG